MWRKSVVVAMREYQAAVRTKAFLITVIAMPLLMGGSIAAQAVLRKRVDTTDKRVVVLDRTGRLYAALEQAAQQRNNSEIYEGEEANRKQVQPRFLIEQAREISDEPDRAALELSERVRAGKLFGFVIVEPEALQVGQNPARPVIHYHSNSPTYKDFHRWASRVLNERIHALRLQQIGLDPQVVAQATIRVPIADLGLVERDEAGRITKARETNELATMGVPVALMMLMFMIIMVGASPLTQSVIEEKTQRIAEVLLGSVTPFELMLGKLLGTVGVSLTLCVIYLGGGFYAMHRAGVSEFFPAHTIWWFALFQALAVLLYGSLFIAVGAAVSDVKEAQALMMPVMIVVVAPMFVWVNVLKEPAATFSVVASLIPPATPMLMILRQSVPPGVPLWQPLFGAGLMVLTTLLCVYAAGRVFRVGMLMQGKGANVAQLMRWIIRG